jgi:hypothetical protein
MEDELELGDGFSGIEEEYELGNERSMTDEVTSPEDDYEDDDSLAAQVPLVVVGTVVYYGTKYLLKLPKPEPGFSISINPPEGYLNERFKVTISGIPPGAKAVKLHTAKPYHGELNDPVIANVGYRNLVEVIGSTFLLKHKVDPTEPNIITVYARAYMPMKLSWSLRKLLGRDKFSTVATVELAPQPHTVDIPGQTPGVTPTPGPTPTPVPVCKEGTYSSDGKAVCRGGVFVPIGATKEKLYLTPQEADALVRAGRPCYIKCMIPIISLFPGIPYFTGCPILPGFVIQKTP